MKSEYKRDINGNYLVLYENEEPDTSSYQMRMLVGNSIPSILNAECRELMDSLWCVMTLPPNSLCFLFMKKRKWVTKIFR
jgi:hypothetical protein